MSKKPAAHQGHHSVARVDGAVGIVTPIGGDVRVNGHAILRLGDIGMYAQCKSGNAVPWWTSEGYNLVNVNGLPAVSGSLRTGSVNGLGEVLAAPNNVFIGGAVFTKEERARAAALARMRRAEDLLLRWNPEDRALFKKWFGDDSDAARFAMLMKLERMRGKLEGAEIVMGDEEHAYAHVNPWTDGNTIKLDEHFWPTEEDQGGTWQRDMESGVLIHESSHFRDTGGTKDYAYGHTKCEALADKSPEDAQNNADSIEYFCEESY